MKHRIQFYIEKEEYEIIKAYAEHKHRTLSNFIMHCAFAEMSKHKLLQKKLNKDK